MEKEDFILKKRAVKLASQKKGDTESQETIEVVQFFIDGDAYAIETIYVGQVLYLESITSVPCTPDFIVGIINLRGQIISIMDLRYIFKMKPEKLPAEALALLLRSEDMEMGILVDSILGVDELAKVKIHSPFEGSDKKFHGYLKGLTEDNLAILDGVKILEDPSLVVNVKEKSKRGGNRYAG